MAKTAAPRTRVEMKEDGKQELAQSYNALRDYLKKLETENKKLAADLERKKQERAEREAQRAVSGERSREQLEAMARHIDRTDEVARRQREFLEEMQAFFADNEARLERIAKRIEQVGGGRAGEGGSVGSLKDDLLGMLGELETMRRRREQLMSEG